jgi:hypothetical protein
MAAVKAWHSYWAYWGIPDGLRQAVMVAVLVISGAVLVVGMLYMLVLMMFHPLTTG